MATPETTGTSKLNNRKPKPRFIHEEPSRKERDAKTQLYHGKKRFMAAYRELDVWAEARLPAGINA